VDALLNRDWGLQTTDFLTNAKALVPDVASAGMQVAWMAGLRFGMEGSKFIGADSGTGLADSVVASAPSGSGVTMASVSWDVTPMFCAGVVLNQATDQYMAGVAPFMGVYGVDSNTGHTFVAADTGSGKSAGVVLPEPSSMIALGAGLTALAGLLRRRRA